MLQMYSIKSDSAVCFINEIWRLSGDRTDNSILVYYYDFIRQAKSLHSKGSGYLTFLLPA
jgi:hypothetical protein